MECAQYQTIKNAAKTIGLPVHAVRRMVKTGEARAIFSGNRAYVDVLALRGNQDAESRRGTGS